MPERVVPEGGVPGRAGPERVVPGRAGGFGSDDAAAAGSQHRGGQLAVARGHHDLRWFAAVLGQLTGTQCEAGQLGQRIVPALARGAIVAGPVRPGQRIEGGQQRRTALGVENTTQPHPAVVAAREGEVTAPLCMFLGAT
nr:hypothetical protein [Plantactinospora sp. KBS50]